MGGTPLELKCQRIIRVLKRHRESRSALRHCGIVIAVAADIDRRVCPRPVVCLVNPNCILAIALSEVDACAVAEHTDRVIAGAASYGRIGVDLNVVIAVAAIDGRVVEC
jgi:hypothetical protein